jgi:hypothetical protein
MPAEIADVDDAQVLLEHDSAVSSGAFDAHQQAENESPNG